MSLFGPPKCPYCGGKLREGRNALGFLCWKCDNCIERNTQKKKIKELEKRIKDLENDKNKGS
jgi:transcription initiation factor IIE alpha subunit